MSTALATEPYRPGRTMRLQALPTEAYRWPRSEQPVVPVWCERVETTITVVAGIGFTPIPLALVVLGTATLGAVFPR